MKTKTKTTTPPNKTIEELNALAKAEGVEDNILFLSTMEIYETQLNILEALKQEIKDNGPTVKKEYIKGRVNVVINPAISTYNATANSINKTAATLTKIIKCFGNESKKDEDPLLELMRED